MVGEQQPRGCQRPEGVQRPREVHKGIPFSPRNGGGVLYTRININGVT